MEITKAESSILIYTRVMAMLSIVSCHILQAYNNHWAYVLNIGVQVFLVLSGYLYGHKYIDNWNLFLKKRIIKLYLPFVTFLILAFPLYLIFTNLIGWKTYALNFLNLQGVPFVLGGGMILGIRHLWFMTAIMFGYFCLPILQKKKEISSYIIFIIGISIGLGYIFINTQIMFLYSWIYLFSVGYCFSNLKKQVQWIYIMILVLFFIIILFNINWNNITTYFDIKSRLLHDIGGILWVVIPPLIFARTTFITKIPPIINVFDKYSYHIYITHYFFIFGPFSLMNITGNKIINIFIVLIATFIACLILVKSSNYVQKRITKLFNI